MSKIIIVGSDSAVVYKATDCGFNGYIICANVATICNFIVRCGYIVFVGDLT